MPAHIDFCEPRELSVGIGDIGERSAGKKRASDKADRAFDLAFCFRAVWTSAFRRESIATGEVGERPLPDRLVVAVTARRHSLHIVVQYLRRHATEVDECSVVLTLQRTFIHARRNRANVRRE